MDLLLTHLYTYTILLVLQLCTSFTQGFVFHALPQVLGEFEIREDHSRMCGRHQFYMHHPRGLGRCHTCSACPPGYGVVRRCTATKDTVCMPCTEGRTYSPYNSLVSSCRRCGKCKHREHVKDCTPQTNTVCGACEKGYYYYESHEQCYKCAYCHPDQPGVTYKMPECDVPGQRPENQCAQRKHAHVQQAPPMMQLSFGFP